MGGGGVCEGIKGNVERLMYVRNVWGGGIIWGSMKAGKSVR